MTTIEDVILAQDRRGIAALRGHPPEDYCEAAARFLLQHAGTVLIATGFYVLRADAPETDGPPGALALGRALAALGSRVAYVSDAYTAPLLADLAPCGTETVAFPIADDAASRQIARDLLDRIEPTALIAIERCALTRSGTYLNMRGQDISAHTARLDHLFRQHPHTVGIGDGGNEIGMGNLAPRIPEVPTLPNDPAVTRTTHLVIASVANWGAYGVVAALSRLTGRNLLPRPGDESACIRRLVASGAVDGVTGAADCTVDSFNLSENTAVLERLNSLLETEGIRWEGEGKPSNVKT